MEQVSLNSSTESSQMVSKRDGYFIKQSKSDGIAKASDRDSLIQYKLTIYENIWRAIFLFITICGGILVERVYRFHNDPLTASVPKGHIYDFWISIVSALVIALIRFLIRYFLLNKVVGMLSEKRLKSIEEGKKRADQICKWLFDICYYTLTSIVGYLICKDQPFLPPSLLGSGSCDNLFMGHPEVPYVPYLDIFYLVQTGTHLYTFIHQIIAKFRDPKFYEYALHHGLALFLLWFSYMMNFKLVGIIVLLIHDIGDVFLIAARAYTDLKNRIVAVNVLIYVLTYPTWVYTRNMIFPLCVIGAAADQYMKPRSEEYARIMDFPMMYMLFMISALALMHIYWTFFLSKAAISMLGKGKDKNGYDS
ncbi:hypothetical protein ABPG74_013842 [Tetrahymena malaccensis]